MGDGDRRPRSSRWWIPVCISSAALVLLLTALLWALMSVSGGFGSGGRGNGMGPLAGDGTGTGTRGEGSGAGAAGLGTGREPADRRDAAPKPVEPPKHAPPRAVPSSPTTAPATKPAVPDKPQLIQTVDLTPVAPPMTPPSSPNSGSSAGEEGAAGGGAAGPGNAGADPGARGDASFTLVWTYTQERQSNGRPGGPDVDIWIQDPRGNVINTSDEEPTKKGPTTEGGRADRDDRGAWGVADDGSNGGGPERVFWPTDRAPKGNYRYGVRWYQGQGSAKYVLRVYLGDKLVDTKTGTITQDDRVKARIDLGAVEVK